MKTSQQLCCQRKKVLATLRRVEVILKLLETRRAIRAHSMQPQDKKSPAPTKPQPSEQTANETPPDDLPPRRRNRLLRISNRRRPPR